MREFAEHPTTYHSLIYRSLLSNYVLNPFWTWFVTLWPEWVAPNVVRVNQALWSKKEFTTIQITLSGLAIVLCNFATLLFYDPTYLTEKGGGTGPPNWVYFTCVHIVRQASSLGAAFALDQNH
jgi:hypothetical protein